MFIKTEIGSLINTDHIICVYKDYHSDRWRIIAELTSSGRQDDDNVMTYKTFLNEDDVQAGLDELYHILP